MDYVKVISKSALKDLMRWAFVAGKNDVADKLFAEALERTINMMEWEELRWKYEHEL